MIEDAPAEGDVLRAAVARSGLDPEALVARPDLPDGAHVWAVRTTVADWFGDWVKLRALLPETRRWPVAMTSWGYDVDLLNRDGTAPTMMARSGEVDVDAILDEEERGSLPMPLDEWFGWHEDATLRRCGHAPPESDLRAALGDAPVEMDIERWMLRWELTHGGLTPHAGGAAPYLDWFDPVSADAVHLLLLPRPEPWSVPAYTMSYECEYPDPDLRPALFRRWNERYGAEPAANWDTMQQLVVTRPPTTIEDAFELARAMDLLWSDTIGRPGITVREHAFDLLGRQQWFLHLRP